MRKLWLILILMVVVGLLATVAFGEIPEKISVQGRLVDSAGKAITQTTNVTFKLYDSESATAAFHTEVLNISPDSNGIFNEMLGPFTDVNFKSPYWMEISIGQTPIGSRRPMTSAPYAITAKNLEGGTVNATAAATAAVKGSSSTTGVYGSSSSSIGYGIHGENTAGGVGVFGSSIAAGHADKPYKVYYLETEPVGDGQEINPKPLTDLQGNIKILGIELIYYADRTSYAGPIVYYSRKTSAPDYFPQRVYIEEYNHVKTLYLMEPPNTGEEHSYFVKITYFEE